MICCQFIFRPGDLDDEFHRLDDQIAAHARSLPGFIRTEIWRNGEGLVNAIYYFTDESSVRDLAAYPQHLEAKRHVHHWYEGYRIIISDVSSTYGDGRLDDLMAPKGH